MQFVDRVEGRLVAIRGLYNHKTVELQVRGLRLHNLYASNYVISDVTEFGDAYLQGAPCPRVSNANQVGAFARREEVRFDFVIASRGHLCV